MLFIAHRGNINGIDKKNENKPEQILKAIREGFHVEIDVRLKPDGLYLGHDFAQYKIDYSFIEDLSKKLFCHCKNIKAFEFLLEKGINCFFHDKDDYTLTSKGVIWAYPGKRLVKNSISVMPEWDGSIPYNCYGVCTDFPKLYSMYNEMSDIYDEIRDRNKRKILENGLLYDPMLLDDNDRRYCLSVTGIVKATYINYIFSQLLRELKPLLINDISYVDKGTLHHTLLQIVNFNDYENLKGDFLKNIDQYRDALEYPISMLEKLSITLHGVILTQHGIILKGYPKIDINKYRDQIRKHFEKHNLLLREPYEANTCHVTLFRFTEEKNAECIQALLEICNKFNHVYFGTVMIDTYNLGSHTWRVNNNIIYN